MGSFLLDLILAPIISQIVNFILNFFKLDGKIFLQAIKGPTEKIYFILEVDEVVQSRVVC